MNNCHNPNQQAKTTFNNFGWGCIIIGKKHQHHTTTIQVSLHFKSLWGNLGWWGNIIATQLDKIRKKTSFL